MSLKDRLKIKLNPAFYWRMCLWLCCIAFAAFSVMLWLGARAETTDALNSSRRIIIKLADGSFEKPPQPEAMPEAPPGAGGETATPTSDATTATSTAVATATPTATAEATPTAMATPTPTAVIVATPTVTVTLPAPEPDAPVPNSTAVVPLNPVKESMREKLSVGTLPIIGPEGKPWHYYSKPYALQGNHPMIAILVTGLGQTRNVTSAAIKLPENISLSFSPYAHDVGTWSNSARATGHEVFIDLPMEPTNYPASDPGPYGLLTSKSKEENVAHLQWLMGRIQGYAGFATPNNETYSQSDENFKLTLELINSRGLMLFMPHEPVRKETKQIMDDSKIAYTIADAVLDEELSSEAIQERLTALEKAATKHGYAVGYARGIPLTMTELAAWSAKLEERGFTLVPLTYVTSRKFKQ